MKVLILSDIHDDIQNLEKALTMAADCSVLICCGDLCSPFIVPVLGRFPGPTHVVFGNNDADRFRMAGVAAQFPSLTLHGEYCELKFEGLTFSVNHFDHIGRAIAAGDVFDVVCFGHNHQFEITPNRRTLSINPGKIFRAKDGVCSFVVFDTAERTANRMDL